MKGEVVKHLYSLLESEIAIAVWFWIGALDSKVDIEVWLDAGMLKSEMGIDVMFGVSGGRVSPKARERKKIGSNRRGKGWHLP